MKALVSAILALFLLNTTVFADAKKGQKLFLKKMKSCKKDGVKNGLIFATKHTQSEWIEIKETNKLRDEFKNICPSTTKKIDKMKDKHINDLYDFSYDYASDSGNIPSC